MVTRISRTEQQLTRWKAQLAEQDEPRAKEERLEREARVAALRSEVAAIEKHVEDERARAAALKTKLEGISLPVG